MPDLLFEIGTEELPARAAPRALEDLARLAALRLREARLTHGDLRALGTARRLTLIVRDLAESQPTLADTVVGPSTTSGPRAAEGFARKHGQTASALIERDGRFVLDRAVEGKAARALLPDLLARLVRELPFPKPMRWGDGQETFARPVLWLVALFHGEVVPCEFHLVRSGRETRGHRFHAPAPLAIGGVEEYLRGLAAAHVVVDPAVRAERIEQELRRAAAGAGLLLREDEELLAEVTWLVEEPHAVLGSFDARHLELPEAVIVSAMRRHQRYFAVEDADGRLSNRFVAIAGTRVRDAAVVRRGNERVLAARLADARFFFDEDRKQRLADLTERLHGLVFQAKLGSVYEKVERIAGLGVWLAQEVGADPERVARAARIAKADLLSHMVGEFPDLQGVMGRAYALAEGEDLEVADAIEQHYLPRFAGDRLPAGATGAVLAVADRLDTLVGIFGVGLAPTGTADPYGLRRAAIGVARVVIARAWRVPLTELLTMAASRHE
ncbi:MAG: glycine--tRNA ligase subunit beta, partial [Myxococcota bacterium]